jgi:hypothetical protein
MKLPAHRALLPGEVLSFILCPFTPPIRRGLRGTFRPNPKDCKDMREGNRPLMPEGVKDAGLESLFDRLGQGVRS